ncbi:cysteine desulfurase [Candidatus Parcubacteria bacterium]|nr:MAG: cysteine desulfurase [Candidatus Parcubacteria bacterium]
MPHIYLDYAASTPVDPRVERAMRPYFLKKFGNPSSLHSFGQEAMKALDDARELVARTIGASFREIVFTGSATEANNLALLGALRAYRMRERGHGDRRPKIVVSRIEHESVLETARLLEREGAEVAYLPVDTFGIVDPSLIPSLIDDRTVIVSVMAANNEVGSVQPISEVAKAVARFRKDRGTVYPLFHTDAVQAFQFLPLDVAELAADCVTISGHKIYGPKGVGALYVRDIPSLDPVFRGGGQEFGLRPGTENVALIAGFAVAAERAKQRRPETSRRLRALLRRFWEGVRDAYPKTEINGPPAADERRLPNILNVYFPGYDAQELLVRFDRGGIAVSSGSACSSRSSTPSYVVQELSGERERARQSVRFSIGFPTTVAEIDKAVRIIKNILKR